MNLHPDLKAAVDRGVHGHLATLNKDGSAQVTIIWLGRDGANAMGLHNYAVLHGNARLTDGGAPELLQSLAPRFLGDGVKFPPMDNPPPGRIVRIAVDRVRGVGPWAD